MKANLKNILGLAALGMTLLSNAAPTWAGKASTPGVRIGSNQVVQYASGSMVGARYSVDTKQYIGCTIQITPSGLGIGCEARDSAGTYAWCRGSTDPKVKEMAQGMTSSSYIFFEADRASRVCNRVVIYNASENLK